MKDSRWIFVVVAVAAAVAFFGYVVTASNDCKARHGVLVRNVWNLPECVEPRP